MYLKHQRLYQPLIFFNFYLLTIKIGKLKFNFMKFTVGTLYKASV